MEKETAEDAAHVILDSKGPLRNAARIASFSGRDIVNAAKLEENEDLDPFLRLLAKEMTYREVPAGDVIVEQGEPAVNFFLVATGTLKRTREKDGHQVVVDHLKAGDSPGLLHCLSQAAGDDKKSVQFATVTAETDCEVWEMSRDNLKALLAKEPMLALGLCAELAMRLRRETKIVRSLTSGKVFEGTKVLCFGSSPWVVDNFDLQAAAYNASPAVVGKPSSQLQVSYTSDLLSPQTVSRAHGFQVVCLFVNDDAGEEVLVALSKLGVKMIALRCAGFDRVDCKTANSLDLTVVRVPAYSPYAVAEHGIALLMALNRKIHRANTRVHDGNFMLDGLVGFDMHGKRVGVLGTGRIGQCLCNILLGFGVELLCFDVFEQQEIKDKGGKYVTKEEIWKTCDVVFIMMPLLDSTKHTFNEGVLDYLNPKGVYIINTSRGPLVDTSALLKGLYSGKVLGAGLDVFEGEAPYAFRDCSDKPIQDSRLGELMGFNNVLVTGHQAFFTQEAVDRIASTTLDNITAWAAGQRGKDHPNSVF